MHYARYKAKSIEREYRKLVPNSIIDDLVSVILLGFIQYLNNLFIYTKILKRGTIAGAKLDYRFFRLLNIGYLLRFHYYE